MSCFRASRTEEEQVQIHLLQMKLDLDGVVNCKTCLETDCMRKAMLLESSGSCDLRL